MSEHCLECGKDFDTLKALHAHIKAHDLYLGEYYTKHFPKTDLYSGRPIAFKNRDQYMDSDFNSFANMLSWVRISPKTKVKDFILQKAQFLNETKNVKLSPPNTYFDIAQKPNVFSIKKLWSSYSEFCEEVGWKPCFNKKLPERFWEDSHEDLPIIVDTREQKPIRFNQEIVSKLDFGDYTASGERYSKTFVDRKSESDFRGTFGKGVSRFRREMDRCVKFDSYMFVVVESHIDTIEKNNKNSRFASSLPFVWHNVRNLMLDYPRNLQFVFAFSRGGAKKLIPKILYHGSDLWNVDVQYYIDQKVFGCEQRNFFEC